MATIRKRGDKFQVQVRRRGFAPVTRSFSRRSDAKEWARLKEFEADRYELPTDKDSLKRIKLADLVERYRDTVVPKLKAADRETYALNTFLRHSICRRTLADLKVADFVAYRDERLKEISAKSLQRNLSP